MTRNIDLALLYTFLDIVKTKSFAASANNLHLTPAAISARIKILEETLSSPLFTRNKHKVQITEYGTKLIPFAESMLDTWQQASNSFAIKSLNPTISISAPESLLTSQLNNIANLLHSQYPDHHLSVQAQDSKVSFVELLEHKIDFCFMFDNFQHDSLVVEPLFDIELQFFSSEKGQSLSDISNQNYVYVDWGAQFSKLHKQFVPNITHPRFSASNWHMAIQFLATYGGFSLLPKNLPDAGLFPLDNAATITRTIYLGYHKSINQNHNKLSHLAFIKSSYLS